MKRALIAFIGVLAVVGIPAVVRAHNAGHIFLPDGTCLEIGSFREAPIVGQDRTQLDLVPETPNPPFDEYRSELCRARREHADFAGSVPGVSASCYRRAGFEWRARFCLDFVPVSLA